MSVIPDRKDYKNCSKETVDRFIDAILTRKIANKVAFSPVTERSHQEVYGFKAKDKKASVVFDTKAKILTITAFDETFTLLDKLFNSLLIAKKENKSDKTKKQKQQKEETV